MSDNFSISEIEMDYSSAQVKKIQAAILAARKKMTETTQTPDRFFSEFCRNGGLQIPGQPDVNEDYLMPASSYVVRYLSGHPMPRVHQWPWLSDFIIEETNRAHNEASWCAAQQDPDIVGMRLHFVEDSAYYSEVIERVKPVNFGMGTNIYPIHSIMVLPAGCSIATFWTIVYHDEIEM